MSARLSNNMERKLAQMMGPGDDPLKIGLGGEMCIDTGEDRPGSLRVAMTRGGVAMMMTPRNARLLAERFESHPAELEKHNLQWIPQTLREVADEIDAKIKQHN